MTHEIRRFQFFIAAEMKKKQLPNIKTIEFQVIVVKMKERTRILIQNEQFIVSSYLSCDSTHFKCCTRFFSQLLLS